MKNFMFCLFLLCIWMLSVDVALAAPSDKKAAELVEDGQLIDLTSTRYVGLFKELRLRHNFSDDELQKTFKNVSIGKRVLELMDTQWEAKPYFKYFPLFITTKMIEEGAGKLTEYHDLLNKVELEFGVEREIVVAIWAIESKFGRNKGAFSVFTTLNTMFDAYPRRRDFYRKQLIEYLLLCRENGVDPATITGSYGGAFGQTQFIPSSFREYAVDFDKDGRRDVWNDVPDVLASIANYLHRYHWTLTAPVYMELGHTLLDTSLEAAYTRGRKGMLDWQEVAAKQKITLPASPENRPLTIVGLELEDGGMRYVAGYPNFQAITKWNNSNRYAMAVTELAEKIKARREQTNKRMTNDE